jgi:hypothetical protein
MLHMPSKISIPDKRTASQHAAVVHWKQLCQLSKKPGTHTIKVPLLSASDTQRLSLRQINPKLRGPDSTSTDIDSDSASFPASAAFYGSFESEICEYPTVYFLNDDAESIDRIGSDRGYLYVLLNSDPLDYGPTLDYEQNVFKGLSARGKARVQYGDRINSPDFFGGGPDLQERRRYKGFWDRVSVYARRRFSIFQPLNRMMQTKQSVPVSDISYFYFLPNNIHTRSCARISSQRVVLV